MEAPDEADKMSPAKRKPSKEEIEKVLRSVSRIRHLHSTDDPARLGVLPLDRLLRHDQMRESVHVHYSRPPLQGEFESYLPTQLEWDKTHDFESWRKFQDRIHKMRREAEEKRQAELSRQADLREEARLARPGLKEKEPNNENRS